MQELINFALSGNVVHSAWFKTITTENGKADLVAINILAEIVYWYKPTEVRDELTGQHIGWKNKYREDLLQKSYASLADEFGLSERQVKAAVVRLEELGVITRVFRTINANGMVLNNVLYIQLNVEQLKEISTYPMQLPSDEILSEGEHKNAIGVTKKCHTYSKKMSEEGQKNATPMTRNCHTNTEITTETTSNKQSEIVCASGEAHSSISIIVDRWNSNIYLPKLVKLAQGTDRYKMLKTRIKEYGLEAVLQAIDNITQSDFLQGKTVGRNGRSFQLTFDWFIRPNNFIKVLEGNYSNNKFAQECRGEGKQTKIEKFNAMDSHNWDFDEIERLEREHIDRKLKGEC